MLRDEVLTHRLPAQRRCAADGFRPVLTLAIVWILLQAALVPAAELRAGTVVLEPRASCSKAACESEDPCCNDCTLDGWVVRGEPDLSVRSASRPLPECRLDGCGRCLFILKAEGRREGGVFVVTSFRHVPAAPKPGPVVHQLIVNAICTMEVCSAGSPCCHSCGFSGWRVAERPELEVRSVSVKLPRCTPDGCGNCDVSLLATGTIRESVFYVTSFEEQVDPAAEVGWQQLPCPGQMNPVRRKLTTVKLHASTVCTRQACPQINSCCNSCGFRGWEDGSSHRATALCGVLPSCQPDGCGRCPVDYEARGYLSGENFIVTAFRAISEGIGTRGGGWGKLETPVASRVSSTGE